MGRKHGQSISEARLEMDNWFAAAHASRLAGTNVAGGAENMWNLLPPGAKDAYYSGKIKYDDGHKFLGLEEKTLGASLHQ